MAQLKDRWVENHDRPGNVEHTDGPLRPRIDEGVDVMRKQKMTLSRLTANIERRDRALLGKINAAMGRRDMRAAKTLAGELAEMRKTKNLITAIHASLERLEIRLHTYIGLGDSITIIAPTMKLMKSLGAMLGKFIPEADTQLNQMADTLSRFMNNTVANDAFHVGDYTDAEAESIMKEAGAVASTKTAPTTVAPKVGLAPKDAQTGNLDAINQ